MGSHSHWEGAVTLQSADVMGWEPHVKRLYQIYCQQVHFCHYMVDLRTIWSLAFWSSPCWYFHSFLFQNDTLISYNNVIVAFRAGNKSWHVFYHFVGAVPGSTELLNMLKRFLKEIQVIDVSGRWRVNNSCIYLGFFNRFLCSAFSFQLCDIFIFKIYLLKLIHQPIFSFPAPGDCATPP